MVMRQRNMPTPQHEAQSSRQLVADFFGLDLGAVGVQPQQDTYNINISGNKEAQTKFKTVCAFGNGSMPGLYNFKDDILVWWNGNKIQPV